MESLPNNSGSHPERSNVPKKQDNGVSHRPTLGKLIRSAFVPEDVENAGSYILSEMIIPSIRDGVFDIIQGMVDYWRTGVGGYSFRSSGGNRINTGGGNKLNTQKTNYNKMSQGGVSPATRQAGGDKISSYEDLFLEDMDVVDEATGRTKRITGVSRAISCLEDCRDDIRAYNRCTVADLYQHLNQTPNFTDWNYGWVNLDNAGWKAGRGGAWLILPKALPIDEV